MDHSKRFEGGKERERERREEMGEEKVGGLIIKRVEGWRGGGERRAGGATV